VTVATRRAAHLVRAARDRPARHRPCPVGRGLVERGLVGRGPVLGRGGPGAVAPRPAAPAPGRARRRAAARCPVPSFDCRCNPARWPVLSRDSQVTPRDGGGADASLAARWEERGSRHATGTYWRFSEAASSLVLSKRATQLSDLVALKRCVNRPAESVLVHPTWRDARPTSFV
jgi:hypothetical protein